MAQSFTCPQGHQWEDAFDGGLSLLGDQRSVACPVCGSPTEVPTQQPSRTLPPSAAKRPPSVSAAGENLSLLRDQPTSQFVNDAPTEAPVPMFVAPSDAPPAQVPGYILLSELGRGGMGVVYKARQVGLNRIVALKMVLAGAHSSKDAIGRFRAEAEAVAKLQHPNIVQIYEIGEHERRPYFSMEFVEGGGLNDLIYDHPMTVKQAARIVAAMARAMHAVHQHGVVHRDLKPANVLITKDGTPKITDFGLAKNLEEVAGQTKTGDIMGTPSYMAPEQAEGRIKEIGPATDVYALGAILYEILTARPPFKAETAMDTLLQVVYEEPMSPAYLLPNLPRDIETICLKCLSKDIGKRYASAADLADDLERFYDGRPIQARPVSTLEKVVKWAKRRPTAAALLALSVMTPLCVLLLSLVFNVRLNELNEQLAASVKNEKLKAEEAETQRARAVDLQETAERRRAEAVKLQAIAEEQRRRAEHNFRKAREATRVLLSEVAASELANVPLMEDVRQRLLSRAVEFNREFLDQQGRDPAVRQQAGLAQQQLGEIYRLLGNFPKAEAAYRDGLQRLQELADEDPKAVDFRRDLGISQFQLGQLYRQRSQYPEAEKAYRQALATQEKLAADHPKNGDYQNDLAHTLNDLGLLLQLLRQPQEAQKAYARAIELQQGLAKANPDTRPEYRYDLAGSLNDLGAYYRAAKQPGEAEKSYRQALALFQDLVKQYPQVPSYRQRLAATYNNLGNILNDQHGAEQAEAPLREALKLRQELAKDFPSVLAYKQETANTHNNLAAVFASAKKYAEAEKECAQALAIQRRLATDFANVPDFQGQLAAVLDNTAALHMTQGRLDQAQQALTEARALHDKLSPEQAQYRQFRRKHFLTSADALLRAGDKEPARHADAAKAAMELAKLAGDNAEDHRLTAIVLTRCSVLAGKDTKLPDAVRKRLTEDYASRAVAELRRAVQLGWADLVQLKTGPVFAPLRMRDDFRAVVAEAEKK